MKRIIALAAVAAVLLTLTSTTQALERQSKAMGYGFKVGFSMAKLTGADADIFHPVSPGFRTGLAAGGFLTFKAGTNFAVQPEFLYVMKGSKWSESGDAVTFKLDYFEIPVLFKAIIPTTGSVHPSVFAGPFLGVKLSSKVKVSSGSQSAQGELSGLKSTDFGLTLGTGLDVALGSGSMVFDFRYTLGLSKIAEGADMKTSWLGLMAGFAF
jgi:hypothetical protein